MASLKKSPSCHYSNRDIVRAGNSVTQMRSNVRWNERSGNHWRFGQFASCHPTGRLYGVQETWKFRVCSKQSSGNRGSLVWRVLNDWINLKRSETVVLCERQDEKKSDLKMPWLYKKKLLSPAQLKRLTEHKYSCTSISLLDPFLQPWWCWLVSKTPLWLAPNLITIVGLAVNIITTLILIS